MKWPNLRLRLTAIHHGYIVPEHSMQPGEAHE